MSLSNKRLLKASSAAAFIVLSLTFVLFQCTNWGPGSRSVFGTWGPEKSLDIPVTKPSSIATPEKPVNTPAAKPTSAGIPEKIWYKSGPKGINQETQEWMNSCLDKNPTFKHEVLTDESADIYVAKRFADRPDIVDTYLSLPIPILKADLLRYLLLFAEGGLWSDLDVSCGDIPIREWIPAEFKANTSLVVGWEFQTVDEQHMREFVTWMIMAKPETKHMGAVINDTLAALHGKAAEHKVPVANLTMEMVGDIVWLTGPMAMSKSIIKSLGVEDQNLNYGSTPYVFAPQLIDDVLILPGYSFSASLQQYKDDEKPGPALVTHHFAGSWKNEHGGEKRNLGS